MLGKIICVWNVGSKLIFHFLNIFLNLVIQERDRKGEEGRGDRQGKGGRGGEGERERETRTL